MKLEEMQFIKLNRDKSPIEKLSISYDHEEISGLPDLGVLVQEPYVVLDVDDNTEFLKLREIIRDKKIKCNIMQTTRGGHFWFRSKKELKNNVAIQTPIGINIDIRSYGKLCYTKVKQDGKWREWVENIYDFDELDFLPYWLKPITHDYQLVDMKEGEGRNDKLFSYIIVLNNYMDKERVRKTFHIINDYILGDKLDYKELETILRDESFDNLRPNFFDKNRFMFDKYSKWMATNYHIKRRERLLYIYHDNKYTSNANIIEETMIKHIPNLNRNQRREVLDYLSITAPQIPKINFYFLICQNKILDVRDKHEFDFSKEFFLPNQLNVNYDKTITFNKEVDKFMERITCGDIEVERLLWEMVGYSLIPTSKFQKAFILYGDGSNGKSTFLDMISNVIGQENISSLSLKELNHEFKLSEITDKLANIGDDVSDEYITDSSIFKKLVTGEDVTVNKKHEHPYKMSNTATLMFATNNLPNMQDKSHGMIRRLCIVPFNALITKDDPDFDPFIIDKITTDEAKSYVLNKALEGLDRVFENNGFTEPQSVIELIDDFYREINNIVQYLEFVDVKYIRNQTSQNAYKEYIFWCSDNGQVPFKIRKFNLEIRKRTPLHLKIMRKNGKNQQVWVDKD